MARRSASWLEPCSKPSARSTRAAACSRTCRRSRRPQTDPFSEQGDAMKAHKNVALGCASITLVTSIWGCASAPPPRELLDARAAYARAETGLASKLSPATLHDARTTLERAERDYSDDPSSPAVRDLAYI